MMRELMKESLRSFQSYSISNDPICLKLDANENSVNLFENMIEPFMQKVKEIDLNRYPDTDSQALRESLAKYAGVEGENIICGNGSDEIIQTIIHTFVDKNECIVVHSPTFSMYKIFTTIVGGKTVEVLSDASFQINAEEIIKAANRNKAKIIFLCNPNNPTGTLIAREVIEYILRNTTSIIVVDEAYYEFSGETVVDLIDRYDRLIVLRTLSKAFALAGARIGYGIAHQRMMNLLYAVKSPYNLNTFSQIVGQLFLENIYFVQQSIQNIKMERDYFINELAKISAIQVFPSASNFVLIKTPEAEKIIKMCKKEGIALRNFENEKPLEHCIRITIGTREENNKLLSLLKKVM